MIRKVTGGLVAVVALWAQVALAQTGGTPAKGTTPAAAAAAPATAPTTAPAAGGATTTSTTEPAAAAAQPPGGAQTADEAFATRVKTLEEQVVDLKEKIFRTKARLVLLQETVLGGNVTESARAILYHRNEMGSQFVLESVAYALDGGPIFTKVDNNGDLDKREEFEIFDGRIVPGNHQIAVRMVWRGSGFGMFSYMEGYRVKLSASQTFTAEAGKATTVKIIGYDKGNITTDTTQRPGIRFDLTTTKDSGPKQGGDKAGAPGGKP